MIAQGDFLRLLYAKTEERSKIFRDIFHTKAYQTIQERLKAEAGVLRQDYEALEKSIDQYLEGVLCKEEDFAARMDTVRQNRKAIPAGEIAVLLQERVSVEEEELARLQKQLDTYEKELERLHQLIGREEERKKWKRELEEAGRQITLLRPSLQEMREQYDKKQQSFQEFEKERAWLEKLYQDSLEILERKEEREQLRLQIENLRKEAEAWKKERPVRCAAP